MADVVSITPPSTPQIILTQPSPGKFLKALIIISSISFVFGIAMSVFNILTGAQSVRLQDVPALVSALISIILFFGLWELKKIAAITFIVLLVINILISLFPLWLVSSGSVVGPLEYVFALVIALTSGLVMPILWSWALKRDWQKFH